MPPSSTGGIHTLFGKSLLEPAQLYNFRSSETCAGRLGGRLCGCGLAKPSWRQCEARAESAPKAVAWQQHVLLRKGFDLISSNFFGLFSFYLKSVKIINIYLN